MKLFLLLEKMSSQKLRFFLSRYMPPKAIDYCVQLWEEKNFDLTITPKRASKLGDYSYNPKTRRHKITVNGDLNTYSFLITYIHEIAHHRTYLHYGFNVRPHGHEWKNQFIHLMQPMLSPEIFPSGLLPVLYNYFSNPKASSCSDIQLLKALRNQDNPEITFLGELPAGTHFRFNNRIFVRESKKRTRILCLEPASGKKFLISEAATVEAIVQS